MGLPPKPKPFIDESGEVILERTPVKPLISMSLHFQRLSLRADPGEKLQVKILKQRPWYTKTEEMVQQFYDNGNR